MMFASEAGFSHQGPRVLGAKETSDSNEPQTFGTVKMQILI